MPHVWELSLENPVAEGPESTFPNVQDLLPSLSSCPGLLSAPVLFRGRDLGMVLSYQ